MFFWVFIVGVIILVTGVSASLASKARKGKATEAQKDYATCLFALTLHDKSSEIARYIAGRWFADFGAMEFKQGMDSGGVLIPGIMVATKVTYRKTTAENKRKLKQRIEDALLTGMSLPWRSSGTMRISNEGGITYVLTGGCSDWGLAIKYVFTLALAVIITVVTGGAAWETLAAAVCYVAIDIYSKQYQGVEWNDETVARYKQDVMDAYAEIEAAYNEGGEAAVGTLAANYVYDHYGPDAP